MYQSLNQQLSQAQQDMFRLEKIESMIARFNYIVYTLQKKADEAKALLEQEESDYKKITKNSLFSLFSSVFTSLEKRIEKTEQERIQLHEAKLKYSQCLKDLDDARGQIEALEKERIRCRRAKATFKRLYKQKHQLLLESHDGIGQQLMDCESRLQRSKANQIEIEQALSIGEELDPPLTTALRESKKTLFVLKAGIP